MPARARPCCQWECCIHQAECIVLYVRQRSLDSSQKVSAECLTMQYNTHMHSTIKPIIGVVCLTQHTYTPRPLCAPWETEYHQFVFLQCVSVCDLGQSVFLCTCSFQGPLTFSVHSLAPFVEWCFTHRQTRLFFFSLFTEHDSRYTHMNLSVYPHISFTACSARTDRLFNILD